MSDMTPRLAAALSDRYRIEGELGAGGMATVYLADDLKHDRKVAVKVLRPELAAVIGGDRFLAEIKTTANLQHPHILPLFDSGEADGFLYYVMPYVQGESLRERLDREKQLPVEEAVSIAAAVAGALDHAHRNGVIHRDIKPGNILLHEGEPLVADFGIALAVSQAGGGRLTETGLSLGTPHYMSPEQATADRELTPQTDIYALGCVLYEMLAGAPPFAGPSAQAVVMQIITSEPKPVRELRKSVAPHVEAALDRALEKLPADRYATAGDFARALRDPSVTAASPLGRSRGARGARKSSSVSRFAWPAATLVLVVLLAASLLTRGWSKQDRGVIRVGLGQISTFVETGTLGRTVALSPEGRTVVYLENTEGGMSALRARELGSLTPRTLYQSNSMAGLDFSPDGESLLARDGSTLVTVGTSGDATPVPGIGGGLSAGWPGSWTSDGAVYFNGAEGRLMRIPSGGGEVEDVFRAEGDSTILYGPELLPGGRHALVTQASSGAAMMVGVLNRETGALDVLARGRGAKFVPPDLVLWQDSSRLQAQRMDPSTWRLVGRPVVLAPDLPAADLAVSFDLAGRGTLVYRRARQAESNVFMIDRSGTRTDLGHLIRVRLGVRVSPDGGRVAFEDALLSNRGDVWVLDLGAKTQTRITFGADAAYPVWTPDGERVAYYRNTGGDYALYIKNADGSGVEELLADTDANLIEVAFVPGSRDLVIRQGDRSVSDGTGIFLFPDGDPEGAAPVANEGEVNVGPMVSPDGRYVAFTQGESPNSRVLVRSLANPAEQWQVSGGPGNEPLWHPDGSELFYRSPNALVSVPIRLAGGFRILGEPVELFATPGLLANNNHTTYGWLPEEEAFLFASSPEIHDLILVLNWAEEAEALLEGTGR